MTGMPARGAPPFPAGAADSATGRQGPGSLPELPVLVAVLASGGRGRWIGHGVFLYRAAQSMMSVVATIWMPPSTMKTLAPMAIACAVVRRDATSHTSNASWLMPAEQRALMRWAICGT